MEKRIKKSLIDKNVIGFEYNPQIVVNENLKTIKERLIINLKESNKIKIAVSYVVWSGLSLIYDYLKKFNKESKFLLTTEGYVTDPTSLRRLLDLDLEVKVYDPEKTLTKGFHLKSYYFEKQNNNTILVGSNNISARAFGLAHEMAVEIDSEIEGLIVEKYQDAFNHIWNDPAAKVLDEAFVIEYEQRFYEQKAVLNRNYELGLKEDEIKPNYMQQYALRDLKEARETSNRGLVIAATGTGKTYLSAFDVKDAHAKKVLFLVHNRLILTSAIKSYENIFGNSKKIIELKSENVAEIEDADFIFTTDKTAYNHLIKKVKKDYFDYIVYDEAHRIGKKTIYQELIDYFLPKFSLGITATPERTKNPSYLYQVFNYNVVYEIRLLDALYHELVCPFTYYGLNIDSKLLKADEKFDYYELAKFIDELIREKGYYGKKLKALLFASTIKEAKEISKMLNRFDYNSQVVVSGTKTREKVEEHIISLQSDDLNTVEIICAVDKLNEGVDIPEVNTIIMLRETASSIIYLQQLGRGLRKTNDPNKYVTVFDLIGNSNTNYTIAEVLTVNSTSDKRQLYKHTATNFTTVSPFINVIIDEKAMKNVIKSISNNFKVETKLKMKFREELNRFKEIPTLLEMYNNKNFHELDLLQLTFKSFYKPFEKYYFDKFNIPIEKTGVPHFVRKFFEFITQFTFRGYNKETLKDYVRLLKGNKINNNTLKEVLLRPTYQNQIPSSVKSEYNKTIYNFPEAFKLDKSNFLYLNKRIIDKLKAFNAYDLYLEHLELFEKLTENKDYQMKTFDLIDKAEFLFNTGSNDYYMNAVGELIDKEKKAVYAAIKITEKETHYDNYISANNKVVYYTQGSNTIEQANDKVKMFLKDNYKFHICAKFPHLGYSSTAYFNLGNLKINAISKVKKTKSGKYNHEIEFILEEELPMEFLMYQDKTHFD